MSSKISFSIQTGEMGSDVDDTPMKDGGELLMAAFNLQRTTYDTIE